MPNQKHWTANSPHAGNAARPSHKVWSDEVDAGLPTEGACDGPEAGRLLALYHESPNVVDMICERVALYGTQQAKEQVSA